MERKTESEENMCRSRNGRRQQEPLSRKEESNEMIVLYLNLPLIMFILLKPNDFSIIY